MTKPEDVEEVPLRPHERTMRMAMAHYNGERGPRDYQEALLSYYAAYDLVQEEEEPTVHELLGQVRAARGVAACLGRSAQFPPEYFASDEGEPDVEPADRVNDPVFWLDRSEDYAGQIYADTADPAALREAHVTQASRARLQLQRLIEQELATGSLPPRWLRGSAIDDYEKTWGNLLDYERSQLGGLPDQNRINMARGYAAVEGLHGFGKDGFRKAVGAVVLGLLSESPHLPTSRGGLGRRERYRVKARHVGGAVGAAAVAVLATNQPSRRRTVALKSAERII